VEGEFGGIQSFIFDLRMGAGGLSKRLRGRSFFVALFTQMTACHLLRQCTLSHANMLMSAGGHFFFFSQSAAIHAVLDDVQASIDRWSVEQASGEVRLNLGRAPCSEDDIRHFLALSKRCALPAPRPKPARSLRGSYLAAHGVLNIKLLPSILKTMPKAFAAFASRNLAAQFMILSTIART
jgi:CRISPR-associated protein Cas10/Csm1 subtype III-A